MDQLERYHRQMTLPGFGREKQEHLLRAKVLVIGAGGLGCPALLYLAAAGVGQLGIVDFDRVALSNLHRQVLYTEKDIGKPKASAAAERIKALNEEVRVEVLNTRLTAGNALDIIAGYDLVIDGSDNFPTRYMVNDATALLDIPLLYASVYRFEGQVAVFNFPDASGKKASYRDLFPDPPGADEIPNCAEAGVLGVLPGIMGTLQASEAIKIITRTGQPLAGRLLTFNALTHSFYELEIPHAEENKKRGPQTPAEFRKMDYGEYCDAGEVKEIRPEDFSHLVRGGKITVVDVRNAHETPALSYPALSFPLGGLRERISELEEMDRLLFVCQTGVRSRKAAALVQEVYRHKQVFSLAGGVVALKTADLAGNNKKDD